MKSLLSVLISIFLFITVIFVLTKIWMPDIVNDQDFIKLGLTFMVFLVAGMVALFVSNINNDKKDDKTDP